MKGTNSTSAPLLIITPLSWYFSSPFYSVKQAHTIMLYLPKRYKCRSICIERITASSLRNNS